MPSAHVLQAFLVVMALNMRNQPTWRAKRSEYQIAAQPPPVRFVLMSTPVSDPTGSITLRREVVRLSRQSTVREVIDDNDLNAVFAKVRQVRTDHVKPNRHLVGINLPIDAEL